MLHRAASGQPSPKPTRPQAWCEKPQTPGPNANSVVARTDRPSHKRIDLADWLISFEKNKLLCRCPFLGHDQNEERIFRKTLRNAKQGLAPTPRAHPEAFQCLVVSSCGRQGARMVWAGTCGRAVARLGRLAMSFEYANCFWTRRRGGWEGQGRARECSNVRPPDTSQVRQAGGWACGGPACVGGHAIKWLPPKFFSICQVTHGATDRVVKEVVASGYYPTATEPMLINSCTRSG